MAPCSFVYRLEAIGYGARPADAFGRSGGFLIGTRGAKSIEKGKRRGDCEGHYH
jgi:hypothetical protein